ncbi:MAG: hypothetical protein WCX83_03095 [Candidatus Cloacimonas sp.]|jgi:hypothetical protein|nr:hypothetical protein [Candidatus Cloacimonadota bacterium]
MKKTIKFILITGAIAALGFFSLKVIRRIRELLKLSKTLPEYLRDITHEKPTMTCSMSQTFLTGKIDLKIGFSEEVIEGEKNLEDTIKSYINDFYPILSEMDVRITFYKKTVEKPKDENEE